MAMAMAMSPAGRWIWYGDDAGSSRILILKFKDVKENPDEGEMVD